MTNSGVGVDVVANALPTNVGSSAPAINVELAAVSNASVASAVGYSGVDVADLRPTDGGSSDEDVLLGLDSNAAWLVMMLPARVNMAPIVPTFSGSGSSNQATPTMQSTAASQTPSIVATAATLADAMFSLSGEGNEETSDDPGLTWPRGNRSNDIAELCQIQGGFAEASLPRHNAGFLAPVPLVIRPRKK